MAPVALFRLLSLKDLVHKRSLTSGIALNLFCEQRFVDEKTENKDERQRERKRMEDEITRLNGTHSMKLHKVRDNKIRHPLFPSV